MSNVDSNYLNKTNCTNAKFATSGAFAGPASTAYVGVYTNSVSLSNDTLMADLTEPTYNTYARQSVTWSSVFQDIDNSYKLQGSLGQFKLSNTSAGGLTAHGYFVADASTAGNLLWSEEFTSPTSLSTTDQILLIGPQYRVDDNSQASGIVIQ